MGFKECHANPPPKVYMRLENDGDSEVVVFLDEPHPRRTNYDGIKGMGYVLPVMTADGPLIFGVSYSLVLEIEKAWEALKEGAVKITRHGEKDAMSVSYEFAAAKTPKKIKDLAGAFGQGDLLELLAQVRGLVGPKEDAPSG